MSQALRSGNRAWRWRISRRRQGEHLVVLAAPRKTRIAALPDIPTCCGARFPPAEAFTFIHGRRHHRAGQDAGRRGGPLEKACAAAVASASKDAADSSMPLRAILVEKEFRSMFEQVVRKAEP